MNQSVKDNLQLFDTISLTEMDNVKLLNRVDTKYTFRPDDLGQFILLLQSSYRILEIESNRINHYQTLYFDTPTFQLYMNHHNDRVNRYKLRFRKYIDSGLCYLEIKFKTAKERTEKERTKRTDFELELSDKSTRFIEKHLKTPSPIFTPILWNKFIRLTFVHKTQAERLTIDLALEFSCYKTAKIIQLPGVVIAEVKRDKASSHSDFVQLMRKENIREVSFSKYCMGALLLNRNLKYNRFKPQLLTLKKLTNGYIQPLAA